MRYVLQLFIASAFLFPSLLPAQTKAKTIVDKSILAMKNTRTMSGRINRVERVDGEMVKGDMYFKVNIKPYKAYLFNYEPDEGTEILYVEGRNKNRILINPNKFPFINVNLDPYSDLVVKDKHHTVFDVGMKYTLGVVEHVLAQYEDDFDKYVAYKGDVTFSGMPCHVIEINYPEYQFEDYTVGPGESLIDIDQKLRIPAYKVLEINDDVKDFFDVEAGDVIKVPNVYGKRVVFFIDKQYYLPIVQMVYDDEGLFEKYEYVKFKYNPKFAPTEFDPEWHEYDFKRK